MTPSRFPTAIDDFPESDPHSDRTEAIEQAVGTVTGNTGTIYARLTAVEAALSGATGITGPTGAAAPTGPTGNTGPTGA